MNEGDHSGKRIVHPYQNDSKSVRTGFISLSVDSSCLLLWPW